MKMKIVLLTGLMLAFSTVEQAQAKACGLNLSVTEAHAEGHPVQNVAATATNLATNRVTRARLFEAMPAFDNLSEGKYQIRVKKAGYQTTVRPLKLACGNVAADDPSVTAPIFLQKGSSQQSYKQPEFDGRVATASIRGVDFLNYRYQGSACSQAVGLPQTVQVRNGKFKASEGHFFDVAKAELVYGDVNGDGSEDAVVLIRCGSATGTWRAFEVHAYAYQNGRAQLLARLDSTGVERDYRKSVPAGIVFYAGEHGPKLVNGHVLVEALTDGSFAWPANVTLFDYQLSGGKFVLSREPTRTKRTP